MVGAKKTMHKGNKRRAIVQNFKSKTSDCPNKNAGHGGGMGLYGCLVDERIHPLRRVSAILFTILIFFFNDPHPPVPLTPLTFAIQIHPPFKFTSVMFKLRTFRHRGGCLQKQERCCRACDSQINPRRYDPTEE